jgi:hypothetical protein
MTAEKLLSFIIGFLIFAPLGSAVSWFVADWMRKKGWIK